MKAAVYYNPQDIKIEEMPKPKIKSSEILVQMKACGICGTDLMDWYQLNRAPLVLGHEPAGVIVETGEKVENFMVGDRVFVHHHVPCLKCHYCLREDYTMCEKFVQTCIYPGALAEYFRVPTPNLQIDTLKIPDNVSFEEATLIEPVACCLRALTKCKVQHGDVIVIIGVGPSGAIHTMLSRDLGAKQIIVSDFVEYRLEVALGFGANLAINPRKESLVEKVREATDKVGADVVIVTAPSINALSDGLDVCRKGGTICIFAPTSPDEYIKLSPNRLFFSETKIISSYSASHIETRKALNLISSESIRTKAIITHIFPLSRIADAFKTASEGKEHLKVVVTNK